MAIVKLFCLGILFGGSCCASQLQTFQYCMKQSPNPGLRMCAGEQAITFLRAWDESANITLSEDLVFLKDEAMMGRSLPNLLEGQDPGDFRTMLENAGVIIGERTMQWDMSRLYPGLMLRVGPSIGANGVLEFVMDSTQNRDDRTFFDEEPSTARILTKQFVLPFLLGVKFKLASLLPIVFWLLILLCKKGLFLLKGGLFLSGLLGFNSLFSLGALAPNYGLHAGGLGGGGGGLLHQPIGGVGLGGYGHQQFADISGGYYKSPRDKLVPSETAENIVVAPQNDNFYDYEKKIYHQTDRTGKMQFDRDDDQFVVRHRSEDNHNNAYRNFAWQTRS